MPDDRKVRWRLLRVLLGRRRCELEADVGTSLDRESEQAREQHQLIVEQAAIIVAGQTRAAVKLERAIEEYERTTAETQRALLQARAEARAGRFAEAADQEGAAEGSAARLVRLEREMDDLKEMLLEATAAADAARAAVSRSATLLRERIAERDRLSTRLAQARLQEQLNEARQTLEDSVAPATPSLEEVKRTIEARLESALALGELRPEPIDEARVRLDHELADAEAHSRLEALRRSMDRDEHVDLPGAKEGSAPQVTGSPE